MERRQRRAGGRRGSVTVEYIIVFAVVVAPFAVMCVALGKAMASYYASVEYLSRLPLP